jgi:peptidoglycan/xylan/chitin deacetylase (PgdA/CDA1 family)
MVGGVLDQDKAGISVSPDHFGMHMAFLKKAGYLAVSFKGLKGAFEDTENKHVLISFDDGYEDNYSLALPILREYGYRATFFLTSDFMSASNLKRSGHTAPDWTRSYLSYSQIKKMKDAGMDFGCHAKTHRRLDRMSEPEVKEEIELSKSSLEDKLGFRLDSFSYPYGRFNDETVKAVEDGGFSWACTTAPGFNTKNTHPLLLRRTTVAPSDNTVSAFERKLLEESEIT